MAAQTSWRGEAPAVNRSVSIEIGGAALAKIGELDEGTLNLRDEVLATTMFEQFVGSSEEICRVTGQGMRVDACDATVLITGESGTCKELIARAIHKRSRRSQSVFTRMNCAVTPPSLVAAELFGNEKGAFTGANQRRIGHS